MYEWVMDFGVECNARLIRFSVSNEPVGFDEKLWSLSRGRGGVLLEQ